MANRDNAMGFLPAIEFGPPKYFRFPVDSSSGTAMFLGDAVVQDIISNISILESKRKSLYADYTEKHPRVVALTAEINELKKSLMRLSPPAHRRRSQRRC